MPTRTGGSLLASRPKPAAPTSTDNDGWGEDAPQLSRNTLQKVESAYKPTKVNMAELTSQKQQPSRFQPPTRQENDGPSDIVRGGYQPIGKVDINAIRSQAREQKDDRPTIVKGAYEPVGKVDIAAIRAKAQASPSPAAPPVNQSRTGDDEEQAPRSLADRSAAFNQSSQSGRLSEMPKPKVANRFGSSTSSFAGTKAPTPVGFGVPPPAASAPIGAASKNFGSTDGKSPAQLWAEKKARERGLSGAADTAPPPPAAAAASPMQSQPSGGWQSGYSGKSWAPVSTDRTGTSNISAQKTGQDDVRSPERETEPELPSGGVGALKDRFKNAAPMGASNVGDDSPARSMPPPMDFSSKPNAGLASRSVPPPPQEEEDEDERPEEEHISLPPPPAQPRSPTPSPPSSPIRVAMPVARSAPVEPMEAPEERFVAPPMPTQSLSNAASAAASHMRDEPEDEEDHARAAAEEASASTFGASAAANANPGAGVAGKRALVQYDYEKAEDNEIELHEGEYVENIEMVDEDWWMGQNSQGETGLFPSNYVELVEDDEAAGGAAPPPPAPARDEPAAAHAAPASAAAGGQTATAQYDYEAAEDNELSFPDGAKITGVVCSDFTMTDKKDSANLKKRNSPMRIGGSATTTAKKVFSLPTTSSWISRNASSFCCLQHVRLGEDDRRFGRCSLYSPLMQRTQKQIIHFLLFQSQCYVSCNPRARALPSLLSIKFLMSKCIDSSHSAGPKISVHANTQSCHFEASTQVFSTWTLPSHPPSYQGFRWVGRCCCLQCT
jgi:hypothetical protein